MAKTKDLNYLGLSDLTSSLTAGLIFAPVRKQWVLWHVIVVCWREKQYPEKNIALHSKKIILHMCNSQLYCQPIKLQYHIHSSNCFIFHDIQFWPSHIQGNCIRQNAKFFTTNLASFWRSTSRHERCLHGFSTEQSKHENSSWCLINHVISCFVIFAIIWSWCPDLKKIYVYTNDLSC